MVVGLVLTYAVLMAVWWLPMKTLTCMAARWWVLGSGTVEIKFPSNVIRFVSGMGAGGLIVLSLVDHGGLAYLMILPEKFWWSLSGTVGLNIAIAYLYLKAVEKSPLSVAVHVTLLSPIVAIFTSSYLYGVDPVPGTLALVGMLTVLTGLYFLHFNPRNEYGWNPLGPILEIWRSRGRWLWYALGVALCGGLAVPLDKQCVRLSDYALAPGLTLFLAWGLFYGLMALRAKDFQKLPLFAHKRPGGLLVALAVAFCIANGFQAAAYNYQYAAVVASLKRLDAPFVVMLSWVFFREEEHKHGHLLFRIIGSLTAFAGAAIIGFSKFVG